MDLINRYIPINKVQTRMENLDIFLMKKNPSLNIYPLNDSYNYIYDFSNLKYSILNWNYFSESVTSNINKVCELLKVIKKNGNQQDLQEATNIINKEIIPYLKNPTEFKYNFNKLNESMPEIVSQIINKITEQAECDRVIYNKDLIEKRFNIKKVFSHILEGNSFYETIYNFCNLVDTYDMPLKSKYCIANEIALLFAKDYYEKLPIKLIEETIIDYFMIHYGTNDIPKFLDTIQDAINKDNFISENATEYLKYINKIYENIDGTDYEKEVLNHFKENVGISFVLNYTDYGDNLKNSYGNILTEMRLFNRSQNHARDLLTKLKISPTRTVGMVKDSLESTFFSISDKDVELATSKLLEGTFFVLITLQTVTVGLITLIVGGIGNMIYERYFSDKAKLKDAIDTMKQHKSEVEKQMHIEVVISKKERLRTYINSLQEEIDKLELQLKELENKEKEEALMKQQNSSEEESMFEKIKKNFPSQNNNEEERE